MASSVVRAPDECPSPPSDGADHKRSGAQACDSGEHAVALPHKGRFILDPVLGGHILTEMLSHCRKFLEGAWDWVADADTGDAVLVKLGSGDEEYISPDEALSRDVFENTSTGERLLVDTATDPPSVLQSLDELDSRHRQGRRLWLSEHVRLRSVWLCMCSRGPAMRASSRSGP